MVRRRCIGLVSIAACAIAAAPAHATTASVAISGGGLTMSTPSVRVVSQNPTELELTTTVTDARGTGSGWFLSLDANSAGATSDGSLVVTGADATCVTGSACTPPANPVSYPLTASLAGSRTLLFEADPSSGLGAQSIAARILVPASFRSGLNLNLSLSTPPSPGASSGGAASIGSSGGAASPGGRSGASTGGAPSAACSVDTIVTEGSCPQAR
jgi:hypothetical protein